MLSPRTGIAAAIAIASAVFVGWANLHTDEPTVIVALILLLSLALGLFQPRLAWLWAIVIGASVEASYIVCAALHLHVPFPGPDVNRLLSHLALVPIPMVPAFAGVYAGVALRRAAARLPRQTL
jgi:hypothetical protein